MNALKIRGDHCHTGEIRASAPGLACGVDVASRHVHRHPEVAAKRPSKDTAEAPTEIGPNPISERF
jgi:hypothetical protein